MNLKWKYNGAHMHIALWKRKDSTLFIYMHTWPFCPVMCEKKTETIKHRPTPWQNLIHGVCVCVCVSRIICCSNLAMFSEDHSCHCIRCDVTMATFSPLRLFLVSASSHRRHTRSVLGQDGSDREEWGILWLWIVCIVSAKEDYVFGIAAGFWNINTLGWNKENRQ